MGTARSLATTCSRGLIAGLLLSFAGCVDIRAKFFSLEECKPRLSKMNTVFHIGLHKTGTTWFQMVFYPHHKHIHNIVDSSAPWKDPIMRGLVKPAESMFDAVAMRKRVEKEVADRAIPAKDVIMISAERLSGHPASGGADRFLITRRIRDAFPEAKMFCALRNQTDMIDDMYRTMLLEGYSCSIERLLMDESWKTSSPKGQFFDYLPLYEAYIKALGKDNCLFMCYERMRVNPEDYLTRLCKFMGVESDLPPADAVRREVNIGLPTVGSSVLRRINAFRRTEYHPDPPFALPDGVYSLMKGLLRRLPQRSRVLSDEQVKRIRDMYAKSNSELAEHIGGETAQCIRSYSVS